MGNMWVSRIYRQHNSLVVTLNRKLCEQMGWKHGQSLVFEENATKGTAEVESIEHRREVKNADSTG